MADAFAAMPQHSNINTYASSDARGAAYGDLESRKPLPVLVSSTALGVGWTLLYTVPVQTFVSVESVLAANPTGGAVDFALAFIAPSVAAPTVLNQAGVTIVDQLATKTSIKLTPNAALLPGWKI